MKSLGRTFATVLVATLLIAGSVSVSLAVATPDEWTTGRELFQRHQYAASIPYLRRAVDDHPNSMTMNYYLAVALHRTNDFNGATVLYKHIVEKYPGSAAAANAMTALATLAPGYYRNSSGGSSGGGLQSADSTVAQVFGQARQLPPRDQIIYKQINNSKVVDANLGGHGVKMSVDLKYPKTMIGVAQLKELGVTPPMNKDGTYGDVNLAIVCGSVALPTVGVKVVGQNMTYPILGSDFFQNYKVKTDTISHQFNLTRVRNPTVALAPESSAQHKEEFVINFSKEGDFIVVPVELEDQHVQAYFGEPSEHCIFTPEQIGIIYPQALDNANATTSEELPPDSWSIKTTTHTKVKVLRFGPIIQKFNLDVDIVDWRSLRYQYIHWDSYNRPLLGSDVYRGWSYDIDKLHQIIHFTRGTGNPFSWRANVK